MSQKCRIKVGAIFLRRSSGMGSMGELDLDRCIKWSMKEGEGDSKQDQ